MRVPRWIFRLQHRLALTHNEFLAVTVVAALLIGGELLRQYVHEHPKYDAEFYRARDSLLVALSRDSTRIDTAHVSIADTTAATGVNSSNTATEGMDPGSREDLMDVNNASIAELVRLPGIGPHLAQRIVEYRDQNGPFRTVRELERVSGIGPRKVEALAPLVIVRP